MSDPLLLEEPIWYAPLRKPEWLLPPVREDAPLVVVTPAPSLDVVPSAARSLYLGLPLYVADAIRFSTDARVLASADPWAGARGAVANVVTSVGEGQVSAGDIRHGAADDSELGDALAGLGPEVVATLAEVGVRAAWSTVFSAPPPAVAQGLVRAHHLVSWLGEPATYEPVESGDRDATAAKRAEVHRVLAGLADVAARAGGVIGVALFYAALALTKAAGSDIYGAFRLQANALAMGATDPRDPVYRLSIAALSIFGEDEAASSRARELKPGADPTLARWLTSAVRIGAAPEPGWADEIQRLREERGDRLRAVLEADDPTALRRLCRLDGAMSHVFPRVTRALPTAVDAEGAWITAADGTRYLDAAGGAIVVGVGHGDRALIDAATTQLERTQYTHGTAFTTEVLETYADELAPLLPLDDARIYPVSGGSEAVETALKMARTFHVANGHPGRVNVIARRSSYHGNTLGALDLSGKEPLRKPYTPWLGRFLHAPRAYEYRCENPSHPDGCGAWHGAELARMIESYGPDTVAAFVAEPIAGATLGAAVPCEDYWVSVGEVCRRYGVLVIADEVMTGFGRSGRWFGVDHWNVRPDIVTAGKGTTSGYVPFGFAACTGSLYDAIATKGPFVHGFTWSHNALGAAVALATLRRLRDDGLIDRSRDLGAKIQGDLAAALDQSPVVGDVRGLGMMIGIELVRDRETKEPFARGEQMTERVLAAAREAGLLLYSSTGHVDGRDGDLLMLGPPFTLTDDDTTMLVDRTVAAITSVP